MQKTKLITIFVFFLHIHTSSSFIIHTPSIKNANRHSIPKHKHYVLCSNIQNKQNNQTPVSWTKEEGLKLFDIQTTPEIWAIVLVYFVQGVLGISRLALTFYYKDTLHLGPADLSLISSISAIPWVIKPLYGFISDTFPFFGYKRRSYLVLSGLLATLSWSLLAILSASIDSGIIHPTDSFVTIISVFLVTMSTLGVAFSDVIVDAIVVNKSRTLYNSDNDKAGALQSICWSSSSIGAILSGIFSGTLVQKFGSTFVFTLTTVIPLIITAVSGLIEEKKIHTSIDQQYQRTNTMQLLQTQMKNVWSVLSQKSVLSPLIFLILWQATPSAGSALFYFEVNNLGFPPEFLGRLGLISSLSSLLGILIYNQKLKSLPLRTIFKWTCIFGAFLGMTPLILVTHLNRQLGLSDRLFAIGDDIILTVLGQIAFMPILVLATKLCPPGVEAMLYATLMSINNLSGIVAGLLGSVLTRFVGITEHNFSNLPLLIIITNLTGLLPLAFLNLLPKEKKINQEEGNDTNS
jgi:folate/biopterin transporter